MPQFIQRELPLQVTFPSRFAANLLQINAQRDEGVTKTAFQSSAPLFFNNYQQTNDL
jgi:hypothetical protein